MDTRRQRDRQGEYVQTHVDRDAKRQRDRAIERQRDRQGEYVKTHVDSETERQSHRATDRESKCRHM